MGPERTKKNKLQGIKHMRVCFGKVCKERFFCGLFQELAILIYGVGQLCTKLEYFEEYFDLSVIGLRMCIIHFISEVIGSNLMGAFHWSQPYN